MPEFPLASKQRQTGILAQLSEFPKAEFSARFEKVMFLCFHFTSLQTQDERCGERIIQPTTAVGSCCRESTNARRKLKSNSGGL